jgi:hypothetical protein
MSTIFSVRYIAHGNVCVPDDLLAEWRNSPPGSKMESFQRTLKASLRERAKIPTYDQTKWMTVDSRVYSTWNPAARSGAWSRPPMEAVAPNDRC